MGYLEDLKKEAEDRQKQADAQIIETQTQQTQREERFRTQVKPALKRLRDYLHDLTEQLNYLKPDTPVTYDIKGYGEVKDFQQQDYRLISLDNLDIPNKSTTKHLNDTRSDFLLRCICKTPYKYRLKKHKDSEVQLQRQYFTQHNISFTCNEETDANYKLTRAIFVFEPELIVEFKFTGNFEASTINLTVRNFSDLNSQALYTLKPEQINGPFLDEMAKYISRQPHRFRMPNNKKKTRATAVNR